MEVVGVVCVCVGMDAMVAVDLTHNCWIYIYIYIVQRNAAVFVVVM